MIDPKDHGRELLNLTRQPIPCYRILKQILERSADDAELGQAYQDVINSLWYAELSSTQLANGSWGRFHSRDSKVKTRFPTTELALTRALALGLDRSDTLLARTYLYIESVVGGIRQWTDPPEKHDGWAFNTHTISAATLARLDEQHALLTGPARY